MDQHPNQERVEYSYSIHVIETRDNNCPDGPLGSYAD